jgi:transcriptional regulator with XRE-family HTH domain
MPAIDGAILRAWRRSRGWDVPEVARRLRRAARDSGQTVAAHSGLVRMIYGWERGDHQLTERYELLYRALGFDGASASPPSVLLEPADDLNSGLGTADEARNIMAWITGTNTSDDAIEEMARAATYLAEAHTRVPPRKVLPEVLGVHQAVQAMLRSGRQRLRQTRNLLRIDSELLAHACLLLGDLGHYDTARVYGSAAHLSAQESEADEGIAWSVMAKTARWQVRFAESAELARRGFEVSARAPVRTELAYREANAIALFGDAPRARAALQRADRTAEDLDDDGTSVWSFSRQRQAIFALSVCLHTRDPDSALRAAARADAYWSAGGAKVTATWAQVRAGAAMAYLLKNSLDGAATQLVPVLELSPELRIQTVTGYLDEVCAMLAGHRFAGSTLAAGLRQQISEFNAAAV